MKLRLLHLICHLLVLLSLLLEPPLFLQLFDFLLQQFLLLHFYVPAQHPVKLIQVLGFLDVSLVQFVDGLAEVH